MSEVQTNLSRIPEGGKRRAPVRSSERGRDDAVYGGVEDALRAFGWAGSKSSVYRDVQAAGEAVKRLRAAQDKRKVQVAGSDTTFVICNMRLYRQ